MATPEEKQELVDNLKGKRYYRFNLWGYGGEAAYIELNDQAYDYWNNIKESEGSDEQIMDYMLNAEDVPIEESSVPSEANFMYDEDGGRPWYEHHDEFSHQWGVALDSARLTIEEVDSLEYNAKVIKEIRDGDDLNDYIANAEEEHNVTILEMGVADGTDNPPDNILQFYSAEKGTFFDGVIETVGEFDPKKLKVHTEEFPNGEDIVTSIEYNGVDVDNAGGDTNGKGYSVYLWKT